TPSRAKMRYFANREIALEKDILQDRLYSYAKWCAARQGYRFGQGADGDIQYMTQQSIEKMFGNTLPKRPSARHEAMLVQAEASLSLLVATMIRGSREIKGYAASHDNVIGEETMGYARSLICPLFPIC
ncbi:MAG: hypothetical protein LJE68_15365, partial [Rhodobacter sp.]|nr:hypothetical protein [Rhodobacter sp.]